MDASELLREAERQLTICNSCRYCEGYCAVFPEAELHKSFTKQDVEYLATVCFDCRDCYYACQYAPPHEFAINIPKLFTEVRHEVYQEHVWPGFIGKLVRSSAWFVVRVGLSVLALMVALALAVAGPSRFFSIHTGPGAFYHVVPYALMVTLFLVFGAFWALAWVMEGLHFWREIRSSAGNSASGRKLVKAALDGFTVRYLGGAGTGCAYPTAKPSMLRRVMHHFVAFGFLLDLVSTSLASIYQHVFHVEAPYPVLHPVVLTGVIGGIGIIVGSIGLLAMKKKSDKLVTDRAAVLQDNFFLVALCAVGLTGMLLLAFRNSAAMGSLLAVHLGTVAGFFITAPYSKFRHALYRYVALVRHNAGLNVGAP